MYKVVFEAAIRINVKIKILKSKFTCLFLEFDPIIVHLCKRIIYSYPGYFLLILPAIPDTGDRSQDNHFSQIPTNLYK